MAATEVRIGDAAVALDPLSGQGVCEAVRVAPVAAALRTLISGADPTPVREFLAERACELWQQVVAVRRIELS
jgi:2-polyprenyl-6-methoxyphenol hydroxylase-like FAD-dependent oxidoreductase